MSVHNVKTLKILIVVGFTLCTLQMMDAVVIKIYLLHKSFSVQYTATVLNLSLRIKSIIL